MCMEWVSEKYEIPQAYYKDISEEESREQSECSDRSKYNCYK